MPKAFMEKDSADFEKLAIVDIGSLDFATSVKEHVDFTWIYYEWDEVVSELKNFL